MSVHNSTAINSFVRNCLAETPLSTLGLDVLVQVVSVADGRNTFASLVGDRVDELLSKFAKHFNSCFGKGVSEQLRLHYIIVLNNLCTVLDNKLGEKHCWQSPQNSLQTHLKKFFQDYKDKTNSNYTNLILTELLRLVQHSLPVGFEEAILVTTNNWDNQFCDLVEPLRNYLLRTTHISSMTQILRCLVCLEGLKILQDSEIMQKVLDFAESLMSSSDQDTRGMEELFDTLSYFLFVNRTGQDWISAYDTLNKITKCSKNSIKTSLCSMLINNGSLSQKPIIEMLYQLTVALPDTDTRKIRPLTAWLAHHVVSNQLILENILPNVVQTLTSFPLSKASVVECNLWAQSVFYVCFYGNSTDLGLFSGVISHIVKQIQKNQSCAIKPYLSAFVLAFVSLACCEQPSKDLTEQVYKHAIDNYKLMSTILSSAFNIQIFPLLAEALATIGASRLRSYTDQIVKKLLLINDKDNYLFMALPKLRALNILASGSQLAYPHWSAGYAGQLLQSAVSVEARLFFSLLTSQASYLQNYLQKEQVAIEKSELIKSIASIKNMVVEFEGAGVGQVETPQLDTVSQIVQNMEAIVKQLEKPDFSVVVYGKAKAGKTTLLRNLCNTKSLPVDYTECTGCIIELVYGETEYNELVFNRELSAKDVTRMIKELMQTDGIQHMLSSPEMIQHLEKQDPTKSPTPFVFKGGIEQIADVHFLSEKLQIFLYTVCQCLRVHLPNDLLKDGIRFVDTPGVEKNETRTQITKRYVREEADMIMAVGNFMHGWTTTEKNAIKAFNDSNKPLLLVVSWWKDAVETGEPQKILTDLQKELKDLMVFSDNVYKIGKNFQDFDMPRLYYDLERFLKQKKIDVIVKTAAVSLQKELKMFLTTQVLSPSWFLRQKPEHQALIISKLHECGKAYAEKKELLAKTIKEGFQSIEPLLTNEIRAQLIDVIIPALKELDPPVTCIDRAMTAQYMNDQLLELCKNQLQLKDIITEETKSIQMKIEPMYTEMVGMINELLPLIGNPQNLAHELESISPNLGANLEYQAGSTSRTAQDVLGSLITFLGVGINTTAETYKALNDAVPTDGKLAVVVLPAAVIIGVFRAAFQLYQDKQTTWKPAYISHISLEVNSIAAAFSKQITEHLMRSWTETFVKNLTDLENSLLRPIQEIQKKVAEHSGAFHELQKKHNVCKTKCVSYLKDLEDIIQKLNATINDKEWAAQSENNNKGVVPTKSLLRNSASCVVSRLLTEEESGRVRDLLQPPDDSQIILQRQNEISLDKFLQDTAARWGETKIVPPSKKAAEPKMTSWPQFSITLAKKVFEHVDDTVAFSQAMTAVRSQGHALTSDETRRSLAAAKLSQLVYSVPRKTSEAALRPNFKEELRSKLAELGFSLELICEQNSNPLNFSFPAFMICRNSETRELAIVVAGTSRWEDCLLDVHALPVESQNQQLHSGICKAAQTVHTEISPWLQEHKTQLINVTGHSLGGGISVALSWMLLREGFKVQFVHTFGAPLVFHRSVPEELKNISVLHFVNQCDIVPRLLGSRLIGSFVASLENLSGLDVSRHTESLAAIQHYVPFGNVVFIGTSNDKISIHKVLSWELQKQLLQFSAWNWSDKSVHHHLIQSYLDHMSK